MRNVGTWIIAGAVLLSISGTACSQRGNSTQLAALESAYKSGILTKDEYAEKRARLLAQTDALAALEKARGAGVLTQDEYLAKKTALLAAAGAPPPPPNPVASAGEASYTALPAPSDAGNAPPPAPAATAPPAAPATSAAVPSAPAAGDPQGHSYRMKVVKVLDEHGFERPLPSVSMLVPVDWQAQGSTTWNIKDNCNTIQTRLQATGPDGRAYEIFPAFNWVWADDPKFQQQYFAQKAQLGVHACDVMPPMSAQDYLRRNLARVRPNAQLAGFEPAPKLMETLAQQARQTEQAARQYNRTQQVKYDAIKARVKYTLNGKPMEEWIIAATVITGTRSPGLNIQTMQQIQSWSYSCAAYLGAERAPQGQLDANQNFFELINSTYRANPEWQAKVAGNALAIQKIEQKGIRDRSAIVAKSAEDTRNTQRQIYENQSASEDRTSTSFSQYQRGVETYRNPASGETVDLDSNYGHAWVNNRGEYLLSDQAGFDPNTIFKNNEDWKPLDHVNK